MWLINDHTEINMRMRYKKHLEERMAKVNDVLLHRECELFYQLTEQEKNFIINPTDVFNNTNPIYLELGCGKGAFAIKSAKLHPERNYIALEKLSNVIIGGCEQAQKEGLKNLKFLNCRAENLLYYLPPKSVKEIILNFSCPFPKKTYANRRLTSKNYLEIYKKLLLPDGIIRQKTDDKNFFEYSIDSYIQNGFEPFDITENLGESQDGNITTEYEEKFRALGKNIYFLKAKIKD